MNPASYPFSEDIAWHPDPEVVAGSNLTRFMQEHGIPDLDTLQQRSVEDREWFWHAVIQDLGIRFRKPYSRVMDAEGGPEFPRWCVGGRMNIVDSLLDRWIEDGHGERAALRFEGEDGTVRVLSYAELNAEVCRVANALRRAGIGPGDAVGLMMPMCVELAAAFLAVIKVGGIILPLFSGYGPSAVATRLRDAEAAALFTADGFRRRGRPVELKPTVDEALGHCPTVRTVIVLDHAGLAPPLATGRDISWSDFVDGQPDEAETREMDAEDVLMVIYTSGTTGRPKGAVHTHCGFPIKAAQDMVHAMDLKPGEVMYWMTDMGWMMGPWLVFGALAAGATMVFYDGAPDHPAPDRVWEVVSRHGVTHLGLSPVLVRALAPHGADLPGRHDLSALRAVGSTGSPWDPDSWRWLFRNVLEARKPILNYSGGTEISGGIVCGNFFRPLRPCAFSGPVPGMDADVLDEEGNPVRGAVGELAIRGPWIGMTRGFWGDRERYLDSYWRRFPGIWVHGDFAAIDEDGLWYILGRSDDTIKVAGKRLGPAEVEALLNAHPDVAESAAIGVPHEIKGEVVVAFCVPVPGTDGGEALRKGLYDRLTAELGKPLKPKAIYFVDALPKTRNSKVMRRVIRAAHLDLDPGDLSSLEDPATLDAIRQAR
ncbi:MAG: AMP-binding protein [Rhodothermales bacterium]|nr:AMP-binding protein [Rhodothermales bacterium]MBO6781272.1 AMP-binding protein [Rhodothermales bacterium]